MPFISRKTANYSIPDSADDEIIIYESGSFTVNLPYAKATGRYLSIINNGTGSITVTPQPLDTIQAQTSMTLTQYDTMTIMDADNQQWIII